MRPIVRRTRDAPRARALAASRGKVTAQSSVFSIWLAFAHRCILTLFPPPIGPGATSRVRHMAKDECSNNKKAAFLFTRITPMLRGRVAYGFCLKWVGICQLYMNDGDGNGNTGTVWPVGQSVRLLRFACSRSMREQGFVSARPADFSLQAF